MAYFSYVALVLLFVDIIYCDNQPQKDILTVLKSESFLSCGKTNALLDPLVAKHLGDCRPLVDGWRMKINQTIASSLLCIAYYDVNLQLCNVSKLKHRELKLPKNKAEFDALSEKIDGDLKDDFCIQSVHSLREMTFSNDTLEYWSILEKLFSKDNTCRRLCYTFDDVAVKPVCQFILWGNLQIQNVLNTVAPVNETAPEQDLSAPAIDKPQNDTKPPLASKPNNATVVQSQPDVASKSEISVAKVSPNDTVVPAKIVQEVQKVQVIPSEIGQDLKSAEAVDELAPPESEPKPNPDKNSPIENENVMDGDDSDDPEQQERYEEEITPKPPVKDQNNEDTARNEGQIQETPKSVDDAKLEHVPEKPDETQLKFTEEHIVIMEDPYRRTGEGHFFSMFLTVVSVFVIIYIVFHNKNRILGLLIEGRHKGDSRRSSGGPAYRRLDNLEQVVSSGGKTPPSNVIY